MLPSKELDALGNPVRRRILELLREQPRAVGDLAASFDVSRPAISRHLRLLHEARLVRVERQGTRRLYSVDGEGLEAVRVGCATFWDDALSRFALVAENLEEGT